MEVAILQNGTTVMVNLIVDDEDEAAILRAHIASGAPDDVLVSHNENTVTVLRDFDTEADAFRWAQEIHDGMEDGYLFNIELDRIEPMPRQ